MSTNRLPILAAGLLALLLLLYICISRIAPVIETDLSSRSQQALERKGFDNFVVVPDGQTVAVVGEVSKASEKQMALDIVANVRGVASVDDGITLTKPRLPVIAKPAIKPPAVIAASEAKPEPAKIALNIPKPEPLPLIEPYTFEMSYDGEMLVLSGFITDEVTRSELLASLDYRFKGINIEDRLTLGAGAPPHMRATVFDTLLPQLKRFKRASLSLSDNTLVIEGDVTSGQSAEAISNTLLSSIAEGTDAQLDIRPIKPKPKSASAAMQSSAATAVTCQKQFNDLLSKQSVQFDSSRATIKSSSYSLLDQLARIAINCKTYKLNIGGHTDATGGEQMNLELSRLRAVSVAEYLASRNIPAAQLKAVGYGETLPIANNSTVEGRKKNRRIEILVKE